MNVIFWHIIVKCQLNDENLTEPRTYSDQYLCKLIINKKKRKKTHQINTFSMKRLTSEKKRVQNENAEDFIDLFNFVKQIHK